MFIRIVCKKGREKFYKVDTKLNPTQISNRINKDIQLAGKEYFQLTTANHLAYDWKECQFRELKSIKEVSELFDKEVA